MRVTKRAVIAGAGLVLGSGAAHAVPATQLSAHAGFRPWTRPTAPTALPLNESIHTGAETQSLRAWLGARPTVLALWASWCTPCLAEKRAQAVLARRLAEAHARVQICVLQTFDTADLTRGRQVLTRLRADTLKNARSSVALERAFIRLLGASPRDQRRTSMPWLLLIDANGAELGRALGTMTGVDGVTDYWEDEATYDFLRQLG